jgi:uncharacterized protein YbbC (DUF1343 family)
MAGCLRAQSVIVRPGTDVLLDDSLHLVRGRRVGLLTNQTGVDAHGIDDLTRLREAGVTVGAIFSPEHGFRGQLDTENIRHAVDSATGIPIFSLYQASRARAPTPEMLASIDLLLIDLQDIGTRTYTYVTVAVLALRAAAAGGIPVIVLDRPNPIGGMLVQGPMRDSGFQSDVAPLPVPLRHGLTMGELLRWASTDENLPAPVVVPAAGWRREMWFDETGLPWIRPSPSMPSLESATHYPGIVLFEATNLSVGRGTRVAFQVVGAPWLDPVRLRAAVGAVPGVALSDTVVVPEAPPDGKYPGESIRAVRLRVTDRRRYDPIRLAARLLAAVRAVHGDRLQIDTRRLDMLAGTDQLRLVIAAGADPEPLLAAWRVRAARFREQRAPHLLYPAQLP